MWDVAPTALTVLHHCNFLATFQILFSLGVFLIAQFLTIFTAFLCFYIWLVFLASPGVATAVFAVNVSFAHCSEAFPGFRWAWNLLSWASNRSLCWSQYCAGYRSPFLMFLPCRFIVWTLQMLRKHSKGWYVLWQFKKKKKIHWIKQSISALATIHTLLSNLFL